MTPTVSVVVLTCAGPPQLHSCLQHLAELRRAPCEVVLVDSSPGGQAGTVVAVDFPWVRIVRNANGPAARRESRLIGATAARGDVVAFVDDDADVAPDWLDEIVAPYADPTVVGVGGRLVSRHVGDQRAGRKVLVGRLLPDGRLLGNFRVDTGRYVTVHHLSGVTMSFRRDALMRSGLAGGEYRGTAAWEDAEVALRLHVAGGRLVFNPRATVWFEPGRPRVGGPSRARPVRRHYAVRNNLELLIRVCGARDPLVRRFWRTVSRAQVGRWNAVKQEVRTSTGMTATLRVTAEEMGCTGAELAGLLLATLTAVRRSRPMRVGAGEVDA